MDVKLNNCFLSVDDHEKAIAFYRDALASRCAATSAPTACAG